VPDAPLANNLILKAPAAATLAGKEKVAAVKEPLPGDMVLLVKLL
jgi:hypothetical protein